MISFDNSYLGIDYDNGNIQMWHNGSLFLPTLILGYSQKWI